MSRLKDFMTDPTWYYTETVEIKLPGNCSACMFFYQTGDGSSLGVCRRHSPPGITNRIDADNGATVESRYQYMWPIVNTIDWCGDGRVRDVSGEKK